MPSTPLSVSRRLLCRALPAAALSLAGCQRSAVSRAPLDVITAQPLAASQVRPLTLRKIGSITLGTPAETVEEISSLAVHGGRYYVLDGMAKRVRVFDADGHLAATIGRAGPGPGEFKDPIALTFGPEGLLVADPSHGKYLSLFDEQGRFVAQKPFRSPTLPVSVAVAGDLVASMGLLSITDPEKEGWTVAGLSTTRGDSLGTGCVIDPRYVDSRRHDGRIAHVDFGGVTARGDYVYCYQSISPVVQVMDRTGRALRQIRVTPPFYVAPTDGALSLNQKAIFDFLGSFTAFSGFVPLEDGFVSTYTRFDRAQGEIRAHLLVCREKPALRCGTVQNVRRPVYVPSLDTVYLEEEPQPNQPMRIGVYRVSGV
jgi:hypothetical protein